MTTPLLALAAGSGLFLLLLFLFERDRDLRKAWISKVLTATALGILLWKLAPVWTRWDAVLDNPLILFSMNGGLAALLGGLFAFLTAASLSLVQLRKERPGTRRWTLAVPLAAGLILAGVWTLAAPLVFPPPGSDPGPAVQTLVPDLEGRNHALADWKGKVLVVNFWATWCLPCQAELPELAAFHKAMPPGAVLVAVDLFGTEKEGAPGVLRFAVKNKLSWTQLTDPDGALARAFQVTVVPTTVVLDPDGRVVDRREGPVDLFWLKTLVPRYGR